MILQFLQQYYQRLSTDPEKKISPYGFSSEKIDFAIILNSQGEWIDSEDLRIPSGKNLSPRPLIVPQGKKRTVGIDPNFLWDNTGYVLGVDDKENKNPQRLILQFQSFREFHHQIGDSVEDEAMKALLKFLDSWIPENPIHLKRWPEMVGKNIVFKFDGEMGYFHNRKAIKKVWINYLSQSESQEKGICLVLGEKSPIARTHPSIKGVRNAQSSGASIISFNLDSFCSYNKSQGHNAPVSEQATFEYTTALNYLLDKESKQKIQIGDATTIFWARQKSPVEDFFGQILEEDREVEDSKKKDVANFLETICKGEMPNEIKPDVNFYILGLAPNAARISVRFWHVSTVEDILQKIVQHFKNIEIEFDRPNGKKFPGIWSLLIQTAPQRKSENISPLLAGEIMRSILTGGNYPMSLLTAVLGRIRADHEINYLRACIIKGVLVRNFGKEISMSLDENRTDIGYLLGRLFAVLEKAQQDATGANTTIKDRFFSSASSTPRYVFPYLMRLVQHHLEKTKNIFLDQKMTAILDPIKDFPTTLNLVNQGLFSLGYYHQKNDLYRKKENKLENQTESQD